MLESCKAAAEAKALAAEGLSPLSSGSSLLQTQTRTFEVGPDGSADSEPDNHNAASQISGGGAGGTSAGLGAGLGGVQLVSSGKEGTEEGKSSEGSSSSSSITVTGSSAASGKTTVSGDSVRRKMETESVSDLNAKASQSHQPNNVAEGAEEQVECMLTVGQKGDCEFFFRGNFFPEPPDHQRCS